MKANAPNFSSLVDSIHNLPLELQLELKDLLDKYIAEARREEIAKSYRKAHKEHKEGRLKFSSDTDELIKQL